MTGSWLNADQNESFHEGSEPANGNCVLTPPRGEYSLALTMNSPACVDRRKKAYLSYISGFTAGAVVFRTVKQHQSTLAIDDSVRIDAEVLVPLDSPAMPRVSIIEIPQIRECKQ